MAITDEQKAATLNKYYHQVFTMEDDRDTPTLEPRDVEDTLTTIVIQKDYVTNPANYRPVSLTSVACKMLEGLLRDRLMVHFSSH